jgi:gliding motility-associated-like protein
MLSVFDVSSQIVINEIGVKPNPDATDPCIQSLKDCGNSSCGNEYIEFYNNSDCSIDISCYIFITESFDGARDGAFRFPSGTVIPARGFVSIGGANSGATFNLYDYCSTTYLLTANTRWYLENGDAWCALYSSTGSLLDAVFWTSSAAQSAKWPSDTDLDDTPPYIPSGSLSSCPVVASLPRPSATVGLGALEIEYAGENPNVGTVLERTTDGGATWATNAGGTINTCNGVCVPIGSGVTASAASSSPSVCLNISIGTVTHTTSGVTSIANDGVSGANGLPLGVSATYAANTITITGSSSVQGTYNYSIALTGACSGSTATGTITINPDNTVSAASSTPTLCINTALTAITHTTTGATGIANAGVSGANGLPNGVSASWSANTITISGTPTVAGPFSYSIPLTGGCGSVNATGTISITLTPSEPTGLSDLVYCATDMFSPIIVASNGDIVTWYGDVNKTNVIKIGDTLVPLLSTQNYYVTLSKNTCESSAKQFTITVNDCDIYIPTAFTPDEDNVNDVWEISNIDQIYPENIVRIYNRWGNLLFESEKGKYETKPWDGKYNGEQLPVASYYFIIEYNSSKKKADTGTVTIVKK